MRLLKDEWQVPSNVLGFDASRFTLEGIVFKRSGHWVHNEFTQEGGFFQPLSLSYASELLLRRRIQRIQAYCGLPEAKPSATKSLQKDGYFSAWDAWCFGFNRTLSKALVVVGIHNRQLYWMGWCPSLVCDGAVIAQLKKMCCVKGKAQPITIESFDSAQTLWDEIGLITEYSNEQGIDWLTVRAGDAAPIYFREKDGLLYPRQISIAPDFNSFQFTWPDYSE